MASGRASSWVTRTHLPVSSGRQANRAVHPHGGRDAPCRLPRGPRLALVIHAGTTPGAQRRRHRTRRPGVRRPGTVRDRHRPERAVAAGRSRAASGPGAAAHRCRRRLGLRRGAERQPSPCSGLWLPDLFEVEERLAKLGAGRPQTQVPDGGWSTPNRCLVYCRLRGRPRSRRARGRRRVRPDLGGAGSLGHRFGRSSRSVAPAMDLRAHLRAVGRAGLWAPVRHRGRLPPRTPIQCRRAGERAHGGESRSRPRSRTTSTRS